MHRSTNLSAKHFASSWAAPIPGALNDRVMVNNLGLSYSDPKRVTDKEDIQLQIIKCFHGYTMKYLNMIIKGTIPALNTKAGNESVAFLKNLIPAGTKIKLSKASLTPICKTLHLAFKGLTTDEIYDILVMCLIRAINKYDPSYTDKIIKICKVIDAKSTKKSKLPYDFDISSVTVELGFDCTSSIRLLATKGFISSVKNSKGRVIGYKRKDWPPKKEFFESGPIAFVYFVPQYFRYYLHEYISKEMGTVESKEGVLQYEHRTVGPGGTIGSSENICINDVALPGIEGNFTDRNGIKWHADVDLLNLPLDISSLTMDWVKETNDKLFRKLTVKERHILYMVFVKEMTWVDIAGVLDCERTTVKRHYTNIMKYLQAKAASRPKGNSTL